MPINAYKAMLPHFEGIPHKQSKTISNDQELIQSDPTSRKPRPKMWKHLYIPMFPHFEELRQN